MTALSNAPLPEKIDQAVDILLELRDHLRSEPPTDEVLTLLIPLVDEDLGIPMLLSDVLRASARAIATDADPYSEEVSSVVATLREAATEIMQWYSLHWEVRRLDTVIDDTPGATS
ncbi:MULTISPECIES: hypothetical protein [unclassified Streptomyces]|uniref:hypothetical protein n=1 Tax=unclassified Streptomyces TaxID=2593676 RepID=UPI000DC7EB2E|nr:MULTISPECIES: hypothetical protein [unclassified Streptomyces]AWZ08887.1 hypothetical protein DRB89_34960 [Streptomyces sp. ICC4]AWZ16659.1 hypothetical protein DRB96_35715 [Streptomyces sp. ICC1]